MNQIGMSNSRADCDLPTVMSRQRPSRTYDEWVADNRNKSDIIGRLFDNEMISGRHYENGRHCDNGRHCEVEEADIWNVQSIAARNVYFAEPQEESDWNPEKLKHAYETDPELREIYRLRSDTEEQVPWEQIVGHDRITKIYWQQWDRLRVKDGIIINALIYVTLHAKALQGHITKLDSQYNQYTAIQSIHQLYNSN